MQGQPETPPKMLPYDTVQERGNALSPMQKPSSAKTCKKETPQTCPRGVPPLSLQKEGKEKRQMFSPLQSKHWHTALQEFVAAKAHGEENFTGQTSPIHVLSLKGRETSRKVSLPGGDCMCLSPLCSFPCLNQ